MSTNNALLARILSRETLGPDLLRLAVCAITFTHGFHRFLTHEVTGLAGVLAEQRVPESLLVAWLVTIAETLGTAAMTLRFLVWPVAGILAAIYLTGILMFNVHNGFFVVGAGEGGWEYNALLIICLVVVAWENRARKLW